MDVLPFGVTPYLPYHASLSQISLFAPSPRIHAFLSVGDTIRVAMHSHPSFIGPIIGIGHCDTTGAEIHPDHDDSSEFLFQVQLFLTSPDTSEGFPSVDTKIANKVHGLKEAAECDRFIWITADQIEDIVFIFHITDVLDQTFVPVYGRSACYFLCYTASFNNNKSKIVLKELDADDYLTFGPTTHTATKIYTEHITFSLKVDCENNKQLLNKIANMASPTKSITYYKLKEQWHYIKHCLPSALSSTKKRNEIKRDCPHPNMSMSSLLYSAKIKTIAAEDSTEFGNCRSIFNCLLGTGCKRKFPNKSDVKANPNASIPLNHDEIINVADLSISNEESINLDDGINGNNTHKFLGRRGMMKWDWNWVSRHCRMTIRCTPVVASCRSGAILSFL